MVGNGMIAGLVAITAPSGYVEAWTAPIIGLVAGLIVVAGVILIDRKIDDPVGALSAHGLAGIWGTLACGIFTAPRFAQYNAFGDPDGGLIYSGSFTQLATQAIGVVIAFSFVFAMSYATFWAIKKTIGLRVSDEQEDAGLDIVEHGMYGYPEQFIPAPEIGAGSTGPAAPAYAGSGGPATVSAMTPAEVTSMKMVVAYIRHEAFEPIRQDLLEAGFPSLSITEVKGSGRQKGITEHYRGSEIAIHLRPKIKIECVVEDNAVGVVTETILRHARTGSVGDGKIFTLPVEDAIRIRTGEAGEEVLQAHDAEGGTAPDGGGDRQDQRKSRPGRGARPGRAGERRVRSLLVHGHTRPAEVLRRRQGRARGRVRGRDGLRRLVDHRLQPDRGVGHDRHAGSLDVPAAAVARPRPQGRPRVLRRAEAGRGALRGRPALRAEARAPACEGHGLRPLLPGSGARVLPLQGRPGHRGARQGRVLRPDHARRGVGLPPRRGVHAPGSRHPGGVHAPRGRAVAARDRHAVRRRPRHGRPDDDLPHRRQGGGDGPRLLRHLHAEAAVRRERVGDAHAPVALQG